MSVFDRFLNTTGEIDGVDFSLVDKSNPLEWGKLGKTVGASLIGGIVVGVQTSINAILGVPASLLTSATNWITSEERYARYAWNPIQISDAGLIATVENGVLGIINAAWSPLEGLGWLAYPAAAAEILVMLYIVVWAISYAREEVL